MKGTYVLINTYESCDVRVCYNLSLKEPVINFRKKLLPIWKYVLLQKEVKLR